MRIATWNVNSLKARQERVAGWLDRASPDVLMLQETKAGQDDVETDEFSRQGYDFAHFGEGRWNGVAIASRVGLRDVVRNFAHLQHSDGPHVGDDEPLAEARMMSALCGDVRVTTIYAPNGRSLGSTFYQAKLVWYERLARWLRETQDPNQPHVMGGDFNIAPQDADVWDPVACHGGTHVSPAERAAFEALKAWGFVDAYRVRHPEARRYTWWDYRAGAFQKNLGMRIDHLLVTPSLAERLVWIEIDREARKGKPTPSDHAPLVMDIDAPGRPFDAGWAGAEQRLAARSR
ncbi:MAG TPA: exodeoxyribonuclease III [Polyangiaceae bacterium]|nr:exodeoxyribonuclease III [Polyangiaceae bacterium]